MENGDILVRPVRWQGPLVLGILGIISLILLIVDVNEQRQFNWSDVSGLVIATLIFLGSATLWLLLECMKQEWVAIEPDGFLYTDRRRKRGFSDLDVLSMSLITKVKYKQGVPSTIQRRFTVWVASGGEVPEKILMTTNLSLGGEDPLAELIDRISNRLIDEAHASLNDGRTVEGQGWSLDRASLRALSTYREEVTVPQKNITAVDVIDNHVCVWEKGRDDALIKIASESNNAHILLMLLTRALEENPAPETEPDDGRMGRIIFERRSPRWHSWILAALCVALGLLGVLAIVAALSDQQQGNKPPIWLAVILLLSAVVCCLASIQKRWSYFRCHERGVFQQGLFKSRRLRYQDLETYTFSAISRYVNGVYAGTTFKMVLEPQSDQRANRISYSGNLDAGDTELDGLRDHISNVLAGKMWAKLQQGEVVPWTTNIAYLPEGIRYRPAGFVGRKEPLVLPYEEIHNYNIDMGVFHLWQKGRNKPVFQESVSVTNFFPGYFMLAFMTTPENPQPAQQV